MSSAHSAECGVEEFLKTLEALSGDLYYTECFQSEKILGEVYVTFSRQPTAESKFLYTYDLLKKYDKLPTSLTNESCVRKHGKNTKISQNFRSEGNVKFGNRDYQEAYRKYNFAVMIAHIGSPCYALAVANRSATLYHLEEYDFCVADIHLALAANYPEALTYKLCWRELRCLVKMEKIPEAELKLDELSVHLARTTLSKEQIEVIKNEAKMLLTKYYEYANELEEQKKTTIFISRPFDEPIYLKDENNKYIIKLLGGANQSIPSLSKFVQLKYSESMGRCLYVSTDVKAGEVLAIEKPYAAVLRLTSTEYNCRYCTKLCLSNIPCLTCTLVVYCDESCRSKSYENGHKYECPVLSKFYSLPSMDHMEHLSLYIVLTTISNFGLDKYIATVRALNADDTDPVLRGFSANGKFLSDQFCSVYTLEGNESKRTVSDLFFRYCYAAVMVSLMPLIEIEIPDNQLGIVGASIVHIICVVASNAHGIAQPPKRKCIILDEKSCDFMPVASLLLPALSLLNHSCDPNVVRYNYNGTTVLRAIQPIQKDSQLFDNYGKMYAAHNKIERHHSLSNQYCFQCNCIACEEDWPVYHLLQDLFSSQYAQYKKLSASQANWFKTDSQKLHRIINDIKANNINGMADIKFLYSYLTFLHTYFKKPGKDYCDCQETIKEIYYRTSDLFVIKDC